MELSQQPSEAPRRPRGLRLLAFGVSLGLLAGAIVVVISHRSELTSTLEAISHPAPLPVIVLLVSMVGSLALTGLLFGILTRRYGDVGWWRMQQLIAASALLNYLPLRAGMFSRIAWHHRVDRIPIINSTKVVFQAMAVTGAVLLQIGIALGLWWWLGGSIVAWMLVPVISIVLCVMTPNLRLIGLLTGIRLADYGLAVVRYWAAFSLIGVTLSTEATMLIAALAMAASMIPFFANGLGIREWVVGMTVGVVSDLPAGIELGIVADVVNRAAELLIVIPLGVAAMIVLGKAFSAKAPERI